MIYVGEARSRRAVAAGVRPGEGVWALSVAVALLYGGHDAVGQRRQPARHARHARAHALPHLTHTYIVFMVLKQYIEFGTEAPCPVDSKKMHYTLVT